MRKISNKGQLNISFGWLFAIIVGVAILVLTIYGVTKVIGSGQREQTTIGAADFGVALNVLETGSESARVVPLTTATKTRIYNKCHLSGNFGKQGIQFSEFSFKKWTPKGLEANFENRYIFSNSSVEGKKFYLFSKPFEFPFKVGDVIYLISSEEKYCFDFEDAPDKIKDEISDLEQANLAPDCTEKQGYTKICFNGDCNIKVNYKEGYVEKKRERVYFYGDALMYAAIFSDKDLYECQVKRLLMRTEKLASLYKEKSTVMDCETDLENDLDLLISNLKIADYEINNNVAELEEKIKNKNEGANCRLW